MTASSRAFLDDGHASSSKELQIKEEEMNKLKKELESAKEQLSRTTGTLEQAQLELNTLRAMNAETLAKLAQENAMLKLQVQVSPMRMMMRRMMIVVAGMDG